MIGVTLGGVTVGIALLIWHLIEWWPGKAAFYGEKKSNPVKQLGLLLPFAYGWAYGALGILTTAGLIAAGFDFVLWASNWVGDAVAWIGVGAETGVTASGVTLPLTATGNLMVLLLTGATLALIKFRKCGPDVKRGVWCGLCLGTSSSVAGLAAVPLANGVNWLGGNVYGVFL